MIKKIKTLLFFLFLGLMAYYFYPIIKAKYFRSEDEKGGVDKVIENHGFQIEQAANTYQISADYLKALCMLESSGTKTIVPRYEKHVFKKLKKVRDGDLENYEHVTQDMLKDANDEALKNLASSWGPFQLMGYKCLLLDIKIKDIRGDDAVLYGVKWINLAYGERLRKGQYKDAFHVHNAGKPFPKDGIPRTYDKQYVYKGLKYMDVFKKKSQNQE